MSGGHFETIPLTIILKLTGATIKQSFMLLRISHTPDSKLVHVIAACEEGVFDTQLSRLKIKRGKRKSDLSEEKWLSITNCLFKDDLLATTTLPKEFENVVFIGKLTSLEQYDEVTGDLIGDELAEEVPEFELVICSKGILLVTYGSFELPLRATDELTSVERNEYDVLQWVRWQTDQIKELKTKFLEADTRAREQEQIATIKENEIQDMTKDYKFIILDLEDRFFQVLESKKRKIRELEGSDSSDLEVLNLEYKRRNAQNLNVVNIEDIEMGDAQLAIEKPQRKRIKKEVKKEIEELKEEESDRDVEGKNGEIDGDEEDNEEDNEEGNEEGNEEDVNEEEIIEEESNEEESNEEELNEEEVNEEEDGSPIVDVNNNVQGANIGIQDENEIQEIKSEPESNVKASEDIQEIHSDATIYSDSDAENPISEADSTDYASDEKSNDHVNPNNHIEPVEVEPEENTDYGSD